MSEVMLPLEAKASKPTTTREPRINRCGAFIFQHSQNSRFASALEFVQKALNLIPNGRKVCTFLLIQFLEGKARRKFFDEYPPQTVYVFTSRIKCAMNGNFEATKGSAALYAWFVWEMRWKGETRVRWIG